MFYVIQDVYYHRIIENIAKHVPDSSHSKPSPTKELVDNTLDYFLLNGNSIQSILNTSNSILNITEQSPLFTGNQSSSSGSGSSSPQHLARNSNDSLLLEWKGLTEEQFILDVLVRLEIVDRHNLIDPLSQLHRKIRSSSLAASEVSME